LRFVCGLDDSAFNSQQKQHIYLLFQSIQAGSGAHIASSLVGIRISFLTVRWPVCGTDHKLASSAARLRMSGAVPLLHVYVFLA